MKNPFRRRNWKKTEATVFSCGVESEYSPGFGAGNVDSHYLITFSYEIDGSWYSGEFTSQSPRDEGSKFTLEYDADDPSHNQYSFEDTIDSLPFKIALGTIMAALGAFIAWYMDRPVR